MMNDQMRIGKKMARGALCSLLVLAAVCAHGADSLQEEPLRKSVDVLPGQMDVVHHPAARSQDLGAPGAQGVALSSVSDGGVRLMCWNIQFLGTRIPKRTPEQITALAERIRSFDAAVLALQEITSAAALEELRSNMGPSWKAYRGGSQNALLFDTSKVEMVRGVVLKKLSMPPFTAYPGAGHRKPVSGIFRTVSGKRRPFRVIGVHCHWNNDAIRTAEGEWLGAAVRELLLDTRGPREIILMGDHNRTPGHAPHLQIQAQSDMTLLPKENGDATIAGGESYGIDHIYVSSAAASRLAKRSSFVVRPTHYGETDNQFVLNYSDHYPVFIDYRSTEGKAEPPH